VPPDAIDVGPHDLLGKVFVGTAGLHPRLDNHCHCFVKVQNSVLLRPKYYLLVLKDELDDCQCNVGSGVVSGEAPPCLRVEF